MKTKSILERPWSVREQELASLCFSCVLTITSAPHAEPFSKKPTVEKAAWVAKQLRECGFPTIPMGSSWSYLVDSVEESKQAWDAETAKPSLPSVPSEKEINIAIDRALGATCCCGEIGMLCRLHEGGHRQYYTKLDEMHRAEMEIKTTNPPLWKIYRSELERLAGDDAWCAHAAQRAEALWRAIYCQD